jgi:GNAT superfamily N-acetyltransferase
VTFRVRLGTPDDQDSILRLIGQAAVWLKVNKNTDQWSRPWPNAAERDDRVLRGLRAGCTWIVDDDEALLNDDYLPVATLTCRSDANPKLWKEQEQDEPAVYVSRLIVNRNYAGLRIGKELLEWAGKWAKAQYGARWLRIDVWTTNIALQGYYQQDAFRFVRFCDDVDYPSAALFQKTTDGLERVATPRLPEVPFLLGPLQPFVIPARVSAESFASHARKERRASQTSPLARPRALRRCLPPVRRPGLARGHKKLIIACAQATRLSLRRCGRRLLVLRSATPGLHQAGRRKVLGLGPAAVRDADHRSAHVAER